MMDSRGGGSRSSLNALLERTNTMVSRLPQTDNTVPQLQRRPAELKVASLLQAQANPQQTGPDNRAVRLLGQRSFDVDKLERGLRRIAPVSDYDPAELYDHHDRVIASSIQESMAAVRTESSHHFNRLLQDDWAIAKANILDDLEREANGSFGPLVDANGNVLATSASGKPNKPPTRTPFSQSGAALALGGGSSDNRGRNESKSGGGDSPDGGSAMMQLTADMLAYSKVVQEMTTSSTSVDGSADSPVKSDLVDRFEYAAASIGDIGDGSSAHVTQMWQVAKHMVGTSKRLGDKTNQQQHPRELGDMARAVQARQFLESQYLLFVERNVQFSQGSGSKNTTHNGHNSNGSSGLVTLVRSWLGLLSKAAVSGLSALADSLNASARGNPTDSNGQPLWPMVYYTLRCGGWKDAAVLLSEANRSGKLSEREIHVVHLVTALAEDGPQNSTQGGPQGDRLPDCATALENLRPLHNELASSVNSGSGEIVCPWKQSVVQLLACAEGSGSSAASRNIHSSVEDFLWFKLCAVLSPDATLTISDVAAKIESAGPDHFNARVNPYLYTRLLLLCQRFERAVAFLAGRGFRAYTDSVHLAIALNAFGLLRTGAGGQVNDISNGALVLSGFQDGDADLNGLLRVVPAGTGGRDGGIGGVGMLVSGGENEYNSNGSILTENGNDSVLLDVLDLGRLLHDYVGRFSKLDTRRSVQYILQLRSGPREGAGGLGLTEEARHYLMELLVETRDFATLLDGHSGGAAPGGDSGMSCGGGGVLFRVLGDSNVCLNLMRIAARNAQARGLFQVAYELFIRGTIDDNNNALAVLNTQLGLVLDQQSTNKSHRQGQAYESAGSPGRVREYWVGVARQFRETVSGWYDGRANQLDPVHVASFQELLNLVAFYDVLGQQGDPERWGKALHVVQSLLPQDPSEVRVKADHVRSLSPPVWHGIAKAVVAAMTCVSEQHQQRKMQGDENKMQRLRLQARALVTFAGALELHEVSGDMATMEVRLG